MDDLAAVIAECSIESTLGRALTLAVSEASTNALIHGNQLDPAKSIKFRVAVNDRQVAADIIDQGKQGVRQIEARGQSSVLDEGGRGVDLIRHYADLVSFTETSHGGLKVSIVFYRNEKTKVSNSS